MCDDIKKATGVLNYVCANRKQLFEKEIHILPSSLKITINRQSDEKFKNTEQLLNSILSGKSISSDKSDPSEVVACNKDVLEQQTHSYNSFEKSAVALRKFAVSFATYTDYSME